VVDNPPAVESQSQGLFVTQDPEMEVYRAPSPLLETQTWSSRKRPSPPADYDLDSEKDIMEEVAPAATALKKRRLAERRERGESTTPPPAPPPEQKPVPKARPVKKAKKEIDVMAVARQQREEAEEMARAEREALRESLGDIDIEGIRDLAIVEEMEVVRPNRPVRVARADESDRWDDRWNGRKNFKKFRRRGAEDGRRQLGRVIVPLEEAKKKDYGIGDDYWLESENRSQSRKNKGRSRGNTQDVSQIESQSSRPKNWASTRAAEILAGDMDEELMDAEIGPVSSQKEVVAPLAKAKAAVAPRSQKSQKSQKLVDKTNETQNLSPKKKRPAPTTLTKPAPAKKVRAVAVIQDSDDSEDETKFRFRKR
jgi:nijmegen breakage syndrome protein 1